MAKPDFHVGDFLPSPSYKPDFLGWNIQLYERYGLRHRFPTWLYTHIKFIDGIDGNWISIAEQTAPLAKRTWVEKEILLNEVSREKPRYFVYRPTFEVTAVGETALQGFVDGRISRIAYYDAQQLPMYWRNWYAHTYRGLPTKEHIRKWWIFKDHPLEDTCSSFGGLALERLMQAEGENFDEAFGGIPHEEIAPSHFGNCSVLLRVVF